MNKWINHLYHVHNIVQLNIDIFEGERGGNRGRGEKNLKLIFDFWLFEWKKTYELNTKYDGILRNCSGRNTSQPHGWKILQKGFSDVIIVVVVDAAADDGNDDDKNRRLSSFDIFEIVCDDDCNGNDNDNGIIIIFVTIMVNIIINNVGQIDTIFISIFSVFRRIFRYKISPITHLYDSSWLIGC